MPINLSLTNTEKIGLLSDQDFDLMFLFSWYFNGGYIKRTDSRTAIYLHKVVALRIGLDGEIDHIDRDKLNCQRDNLRLVTRTQNSRNRTAIREFKGITLRPNLKYQARIRLSQRTRISLGYFDTAEEAARAYDAGAKRFFGEHAVLNFPEEV